MQLDCLLRSMNEHTDGVFHKYVLYTYTDDKYKQGYEYIKKYHPNVRFIKEDSMKNQVLSLLSGYLTCFMCDDQIMFKKQPDIPELGEKQSFALRLGKNIGEPHNRYPLGLDGYVYRTEDIKPLIETIAFNNPNRLESRLQKHKHGWDVLYQYQCTITIPHNRVSDKSHCHFSGLFSEELLNKYLLDGNIIDYHKMDFSNLKDVHVEIDYVFKDREIK